MSLSQEFVRVGKTITITYDTGQALPSWCSLVGGGIDIDPLTSSTGSVDHVVTGSHIFTLTCSIEGESKSIETRVQIAHESTG